MLNSQDDRFTLLNPRPEHSAQIQDLCRRVYPFTKPWSLDQLESHRLYFPDGQLIVVDNETDNVVGLAFSLIIDWEDYSSQDSWQDFTSAGFFHNHNRKKGRTLYGAEVMVDPNYRGQGIGRLLYGARRSIAQKYGLKRIRAGARLRGYSKFAEKMAPDEYVRQVLEKKIYDPTLSFQLNQGFVVLDVAKNYILDDPESLGFAAVIEWLNPDLASENDLKKQLSRIQLFASGRKFIPEHLPKELRRVVRKTTSTLGRVIKECEGENFYRRIESYREKLKRMRSGNKKPILDDLLKSLSKQSSPKRLKIAHAFALQLELVNACESAFRTWRGKQRSQPPAPKSKVRLNFVLTAHPTEARSTNVLEILNRIESLILDGLENQFDFNEIELTTQIRLLWLQPIFKTKAPKVSDEADYIYSLIFSPEIIDYIAMENPRYDLILRTWVGGDKDGHPGVNAKVMLECMKGSRRHILKIIRSKLAIVLHDLEIIQAADNDCKSDVRHLSALLRNLDSLESIQTGDGNKVKKWSIKFKSFRLQAAPFVQKHSQIQLVDHILHIFPALLLQLELRDHANEISQGLSNESSAIRQMLHTLGKISGPLGITSYAAGLVVSNCESEKDLSAACQLVALATKDQNLPVIPLLESKEALSSAKKIIKAWLSDVKNLELVRRRWDNKFEVMVGYSDSAKQLGVLASRTLIQQAMGEIEKVLRYNRVQPIFFHGSGGSVARGGGSLKEQIAWWPDTAIANPKMTYQGEMIQRVFATKEILNSQCTHLSHEALRRKVNRYTPLKNTALKRFTDLVEGEYRDLIADTEILSTMLSATPYRYLDVLRIGSRPSKRPDPAQSFSTLRAIPWVLCWTQSRVLLPTWWGIGTSWLQMSQDERESLKKFLDEEPFFSSFVKALGYTLTKVELDVWEMYFPKKDTILLHRIRDEYMNAVAFVREISGQHNLIWHRPWLEESIQLRSPHIHILNLLQILAMRDSDETLLRETLVGIACGMLTTG